MDGGFREQKFGLGASDLLAMAAPSIHGGDRPTLAGQL
jgi:hypothetical protein